MRIDGQVRDPVPGLELWVSENAGPASWEAGAKPPATALHDLAASRMLAACDPRIDAACCNRRALVRALGRDGAVHLATAVVELGVTLSAVAAFGDAASEARWIEPLLRGELLATLIAPAPATARGDGVAVHRADGKTELSGIGVIAPEGLAADIALVLARDAKQPAGIALVVLPDGAIAASTAPAGHWSRMTTLSFPRRALADAQLLAVTTRGERALSTLLAEGRLLVCEALLGVAGAVLDATFAFAIERPFQDGALIDAQVVRHRLTDLVARLRIAHAFLGETFDGLASTAANARGRAAMAQLVAFDAAHEVVDACLQLHGGRGFLTDTWVTGAYGELAVLRAHVDVLTAEGTW